MIEEDIVFNDAIKATRALQDILTHKVTLDTYFMMPGGAYFRYDILPVRDGDYFIEINKLLPAERDVLPTGTAVNVYITCSDIQQYINNLQSAVTSVMLDICETTGARLGDDSLAGITQVQNMLNVIHRALRYASTAEPDEEDIDEDAEEAILLSSA